MLYVVSASSFWTIFITTFSIYRVFSHDVTSAILVSHELPKKRLLGRLAMLVSQTNPVGDELFSYANDFFCSKTFA